MKIESVAIVGGGSSGWMTAAALSKLCPQLEIALIEDPDTKTVGVGESTLGHINKFLQLLDLKDEDWMPACNATYKNSIRFTNFREGKGERFEYPFAPGLDGSFFSASDGIATWGKLANKYPEDFPPETFARFVCNNTYLADHNRFTKNEDGKIPNFNPVWDTAYHLDAELFGQYLKEKIALPNGVRHIQGKVTGYQKESTSNHNFKYIILDHETAIFADLYIDCTGFRSLLLGDYMGETFSPFSQKLANDKAMATRIPFENREEEMHNVTDCHAMKNGWVWNIPLWNRIGTGYCYSSRFCSKDEAEAEFREHLGERGKDADIFHIDIKHGKHVRAWANNCVGIGLSYGFVEPLESTGLLTTHENISNLVYLLNQRDGYVTQTERDGFNYVCDHQIEEFSDFVAMHYAYSMRTDTPYWRWCTQINNYMPQPLGPNKQKLSTWEDLSADMIANNKWYPNHNGISYIIAGHGIRPHSYDKLSEVLNQQINMTDDYYEKIREDWLQHDKNMVEYVKTLPTHYEYLRDKIYGSAE